MKENRTTISLELIQALEEDLPCIFTRAVAAEKLGGLLKESSLRNYEFRKIGPPVHYMGRAAMYKRDEFLAWLKDHYSAMEAECGKDGFSMIVRKKKEQGP